MNENGTGSKTHLQLLNSPPRRQGKAASAYSASFGSVLQLFPSKICISLEGKAAAIGGDDEQLLCSPSPWAHVCLVLSPELLSAPREQRHCQVFISSHGHSSSKTTKKQLGF